MEMRFIFSFFLQGRSLERNRGILTSTIDCVHRIALISALTLRHDTEGTAQRSLSPYSDRLLPYGRGLSFQDQITMSSDKYQRR